MIDLTKWEADLDLKYYDSIKHSCKEMICFGFVIEAYINR